MRIMSEEKSLIEQAKELQKQNTQILQRLQQVNVQINGIGESRHEMFIEFLIEEGILPKDTLEKFNLVWETRLNQQLMHTEAEVRSKMRQAQLAHPSSNSGLIIPHPPGVTPLRKPGNGSTRPSS